MVPRTECTCQPVAATASSIVAPVLRFRRSISSACLVPGDLLQRALAYHIQERAEGGLSKAALKRLAHLGDPRGNVGRPPRPAPPRLRPGTRLVREWRGSVHQVTVGEDGFDYRGARYASLSRIAREITGTRWSGPLFFGLRKAAQQEASTHDH